MVLQVVWSPMKSRLQTTVVKNVSIKEILGGVIRIWSPGST